jgi:hypothetical protein
MGMSLLVLSIAAVVAALAAMAYAWRIARTERLRSEARVAALAAAIDGRSEEADTTPMFERAPRSGLQGRPLLKLGVGFAMAVLVIVLIAMSGDRHSTAADEGQSAASGQPAAPGLELLSMRHTRTDDDLTVTGLVRNRGDADTASIVAVVFVFDRDGGFVASGRAPLEFGSVASGDESPFKVTIPDVKDVGRYRVSFRTPVGIVPHVDRRATLQVSN